jgi:hypothetical protein
MLDINNNIHIMIYTNNNIHIMIFSKVLITLKWAILHTELRRPIVSLL